LLPTLTMLKDNTKPHGGVTNLKSSVMRYGKIEKRGEGFSNRDLSFAESKLNKELIDLFGYKLESNLRQ